MELVIRLPHRRVVFQLNVLAEQAAETKETASDGYYLRSEVQRNGYREGFYLHNPLR